jgi:hypothetical protein
MRNVLLAALCGAALLGIPGLAQDVEYIDTYQVKVRPEKLGDYEKNVHKVIDLNRKKGDRWIAYSTDYGDVGSIYFASIRPSMADIEAGGKAFEDSLKGPAGQKLMYDLIGASSEAKGEIRRRRWDLSVNVPGTREERLKAVGTSRFIRAIRVQVRPGRFGEYLEAWKPWQKELGTVPGLSAWVSTSVTGPTTAFVVASYFKSFAEMDTLDAAVQKALRSPAYAAFQKTTAPMITEAKWEIHRLRPDLSCPPDELIALDPAFWKPKPMAVAKPKPAEPEKK